MSDEQKLEVVDRGGRNVINISGDTCTVKTAAYPEEHRGLVRWLFAYAKESEWSWADLQRETNISSTTLYRVWNGKYANPESGEKIDLSNLCEKIARFKELALERGQQNRLRFVETSVFRRIDKICREALVMQAIGMIYGESQIGKTESLLEVARRNNHGNTPYVLMPASAGAQAMMKSIAAACHISARTGFEQLRERVTNFLDPSKLLIIDEVHESFVSYQRQSMVRCLSLLRQIQEVSQCGLILCGTNVFRTEMERGEFAQSLKQLRKRGIWELQLEDHPAGKDMALIWEAYKLAPPSGDAAELVKWIGKEFGLGKYTRFLARAAQLAHKRGARFTWKHFTEIVGVSLKLKEKPGAEK